MDIKSNDWGDRIVLFTAFLVDCELKSTTVKTYISAIKGVLAEDGIMVNPDNFLLTSLTRACRLINDKVIHRFPIYKELLHEIVDGIETLYSEQPYLTILYKAMMFATYYGLLRAGEVAAGPHVLLAKDVFIGKNKKKFLFILWSSKTHGHGSKPQRIKISSKASEFGTKKDQQSNHCPFEALREFTKQRPESNSKDEQFFIYRDRSPVATDKFRKMLKNVLEKMNYNPSLYNLHSLRIGRCGDLYKLGLSVETIKKIGRWKSNAVFTYLRD